SQIEVDDPQIRERKVDVGTFTLRGRFAMRLADYRDDEGTVERFSSVRDAFNSPFRPFVLATTSIGQEGLDFHPYCHRIYHWNLPRNPVDLEQREGRIHRYKSHAVRLNLADAQAAAIRTSITTQKAPADPWATMFAAARAATSLDSDLVPYWICEGATKIERRVPTLPFSSEVARLTWLKKSVAVYRLAFGQPRQDDLLEYLRSLSEHLSTEDLESLQIRLAPPEAATAIKEEAGLSSPTSHATESK
ncbi:MAG: DEAD/DEAH box helicase, partial [Reyranella sp.]